MLYVFWDKILFGTTRKPFETRSLGHALLRKIIPIQLNFSMVLFLHAIDSHFTVYTLYIYTQQCLGKKNMPTVNEWVYLIYGLQNCQ